VISDLIKWRERGMETTHERRKKKKRRWNRVVEDERKLRLEEEANAMSVSGTT